MESNVTKISIKILEKMYDPPPWIAEKEGMALPPLVLTFTDNPPLWGPSPPTPPKKKCTFPYDFDKATSKLTTVRLHQPADVCIKKEGLKDARGLWYNDGVALKNVVRELTWNHSKGNLI